MLTNDNDNDNENVNEDEKDMKRVFIACCLLSVCCGVFAEMPRSEKRGFGTNNMAYRENFEVLASGCNWFYNWSFKAPTIVEKDFYETGMDYVPMTWGRGLEGYADQLREYLGQHPEIKYILGVNEPNFRDQANMNPREVAAVWPLLESIADEFGLEIVGPAVNFADPNNTCSDVIDGKTVTYADPFAYYKAFFEFCPDCRVDYLAFHLYMPGGLNTYIDRLSSENGGRKVWLTEFNFNSGGSADTTAHMNFITNELEALEKNPNVFRYAWFMSYGQARPANLLNPGKGQLTSLGKVYTGMSSFDATYFHPVNEKIPAVQYQSSHGVMIRPSTDDAGALMLRDMSNGSWAEYQVEVPTAGSYDLYLRLVCKSATKIDVYEDDVLLTTLQPTATCTTDFDTWGTQSFPVQLTAGKHRLKLQSTGRMYYNEWLSIGQPTGVENVDANANADKMIIDGQLLIHAGGRTYNAMGQQLR